MENWIIIAVVIAVIAVGVVYTVKHFRHESGCCGGGGYKLRKKKLPRVLYQRTFTVGGMHCENCQKRIEEIVGDIHGVSGTVDLQKGELTVLYAAEVDDAWIVSRIERAGYTAERNV